MGGRRRGGEGGELRIHIKKERFESNTQSFDKRALK